MAERILMTAGRIPSSLELARALARAGCYVVVADSYPVYLCQASRAVSRSYVVPPPRQQPAAYELAIMDIVIKERIDLVIPASEEILYLATFRKKLANHCDVYSADADLLLQCHHKQLFNDLARSFDLPVPASALLIPQSPAVETIHAQDYVLKRCLSRSGDAVIFAAAGTELQESSSPFDGSWLIQELIPGETLCSFSVAQQGETRLTQVYRPSVTFGTSGVVFETIIEPDIERWVEEFVRKTCFHGLISVDFIRTQQGEVFAVECNPRLTSGIHLVPQELIAQGILAPRSTMPVLRSRTRAQITMGVLQLLPRLLLDPRLAWQTIRECVRARDVICQWNDMAPVLYQIPCYIYFAWRNLTGHIPLTSCSMDGIEWNT